MHRPSGIVPAFPRAPEMASGSYDEKVDVYSFGAVRRLAMWLCDCRAATPHSLKAYAVAEGL